MARQTRTLAHILGAIIGGSLFVMSLWLILTEVAPPLPTIAHVEKIGPRMEVPPLPAEDPKAPPAAKGDLAPIARPATAALPTPAEAPPPEPPSTSVETASQGELDPPSPARDQAEDPAETTAATLPDDAANEPEPAPARANRARRGGARCTTYRTYNPQTGTYRGYDGRIRTCRPR